MKMKKPEPKSKPYRATWMGMMQRCYYPPAVSYKNYGARGIKVCDRWKVYRNYEADIQSLGKKPSPSHTLDRIDNDGDYELSNIRWASRSEQGFNQRTTARNTSGFRGVSKQKQTGHWVAQMNVDGKKISLGTYLTPELAAIAYNEATLTRRIQMSNQDQSNKYNVTKQGDGWKLTVIRYFDTQEQAIEYGDNLPRIETDPELEQVKADATEDALNRAVDNEAEQAKQ